MYKKKWVKYSLITLFLLVLLSFLVSIYVKKVALEKMTAIPGITCKNVSFNLFSGCLGLEQLNVERPIGEQESEVINLKTNKLHIHGLSYWQYLKNDKVCVDKVIFADLTLDVTDNKQKTSAAQRDRQAKNNTPKEILIENFIIEKGQLSVQNQQFKQLQLDTFSTNIERFHFLTVKDSQQIFWKELEFLGKQFLLNQNKSDNKLIANSITLSSNQQLSVKDFRWQPKYGKTKYLDHHQYRKARLDVKIPTLDIFKFPIHELIFGQTLKIQTVIAENAALKIYTDKNKIACPDCLKKYHYEDFIDAAIKIDVDSVLVKNGLIVLEELGEGKEKAGKLDWSKVYASIYDITNNPAKEKIKPHLVADIQAVFVDDGNINLHFEFPNFDKSADYRFQGNLDKVKLKKINSFLVFSKRFRIKQGEVSKFAFEGRGNLQSASGKMELRYKEIELQLLKKDRSPRQFLSKLTNRLIGHKNNPNKENQLRKGKMYFERDQRKSFISNWWKTMQTGVKSTILPNILLPEALEHETE